MQRSLRILYVSHNPPSPVDFGGAQRTNLLFRALRELGEVDLAIVASTPLENRAELQRDYNLVADFQWTQAGDHPPFKWFLPLRPLVVHKIAQTIVPRLFDYQADPKIVRGLADLIASRQYDAVVGRYLRPTLKSGAVGRVPVAILDVDDLDTQVFLSRLNVPGRPRWERLVNRWHYWQIKRLVPGLLRKFDLLYLSNQDVDASRDELHGLRNVAYLPNIPFTRDGEPSLLPALPPADATAPPVILFIGNFWHPPNEHGIAHFIRHVWPAVHAAEPRAVLRIVGSGFNETLRERWKVIPGVEPIGRVADLRASYEACAFSVVPLLSGAGTNIKVLESLRYNRTCAVTRFAHRGYRDVLKENEALLVSDSDTEMAAGCIRLLREPALRDGLAARGRELVAENYSYERFRDVVAQTIRPLVSRPATAITSPRP